MIDRSLIVREARSWIGTKFHHQGRLKKSTFDKGGVDCLGLIVEVADNLNIKINNKKPKYFDKTGYSKIPDGKLLKENFDNIFHQVQLNQAQSGDIILFKLGRQPQHLGFYVKEDGGQSLIHCYMQARGVVEHKLDSLWKSRIISIYNMAIVD